MLVLIHLSKPTFRSLFSPLNRSPISGGEPLTLTLLSTPPVGLQVAKPHFLHLAAPDWASGQMWRVLSVSPLITAASIRSSHLRNASRGVGITLPWPDKRASPLSILP